jgi:hypothetical protein
MEKYLSRLQFDALQNELDVLNGAAQLASENGYNMVEMNFKGEMTPFAHIDTVSLIEASYDSNMGKYDMTINLEKFSSLALQEIFTKSIGQYFVGTLKTKKIEIFYYLIRV